jgi:murein DD-endopeptidase MepM/ murein hydrolase activator NlpD
MAMRSIFFLSFIIIFNPLLKAQLILDTLGWIPPIDIPLVLSGNFAELRNNHFHAGIDFKTQGKEGFKVYAVQKGYVSRIKIASGGYGKAVYITHPDGYTSVYAHLKELNIQLDKYVKAIQYERESFEVDLFPEIGLLTVSQGDIIGLSGNSGSSSGPHLHFEIRDTRNSVPLNGLFLGYPIEDKIPPIMSYLYVYPQSSTSSVNGKSENHFYSLTKKNNRYALRQGDTLQVSGTIGLGLKVDDYLNAASNRCGVYQLTINIDDSLYFRMQFDGVSFSETRYINTVMDYAENINLRRKLYRLFKEPNNKLSVYTESKNRGLLQVEAGSIKKVDLIGIDAYGNQSELTFFLKGVKVEKDKYLAENNKITVPWQHVFVMDSLGLNLLIPQNSLYDTLLMEFSVDSALTENHYSPVYHIHNEKVPLHKYATISINHKPVDAHLTDKLLLAKYNGGNNYQARGGIVKEGRVFLNIREFGSYVVLMDTIAPEIKPLGSLNDSADLTHVKQVSFYLNDDFSGVAQCNGYIDGKWVLFDWDPKNNRLTYEFDEFLPAEGNFELKIEAADERGNKSVYTMQCFRNAL